MDIILNTLFNTLTDSNKILFINTEDLFLAFSEKYPMIGYRYVISNSIPSRDAVFNNSSNIYLNTSLNLANQDLIFINSAYDAVCLLEEDLYTFNNIKNEKNIYNGTTYSNNIHSNVLVIKSNLNSKVNFGDDSVEFYADSKEKYTLCQNYLI